MADQTATHVGGLDRRLLMATGLAAGLGAILQPLHAAQAQTSVRVAAASDLNRAMAAIQSAFTEAGRGSFNSTFGSSGNFARMIQQGAPFELFLSADAEFADMLVKAGLTAGPGTAYATGRLVLISQRRPLMEGKVDLTTLQRFLKSGDIKRFAIANPEHAPYGARAKEVLEKHGVWPLLQGKVVLGENVSQAAQYVLSGAAEAGIVALSLMGTRETSEAVDQSIIPAELHAPLRQTMVLMKNASPTARALHDFIASAEGQAILRRHGFDAP